jgi:DNA-directed RNA polymerase subunit RPC12/RpoP
MEDQVECPYCGLDFEVNTDDGRHYQDGESLEEECPHCDMMVMVSSSVSWYREASKADCLNGISDHDWTEWSKHWPVEENTKWYARRRCNDCEKEESSNIDITDSQEDQARLKMYMEVENR